MDIWHVWGGKKLHGACFVQGSKNASLPIIAASLIFPAETELMNVPRLNDVDSALRILHHRHQAEEHYRRKKSKL